MTKNLISCAMIALCLNTAANAATTHDPKYYEISDIQVTELTTAQVEDFQIADNPIADQIDQVDIILDKIINIGKKVWAIAELGRPVYDYTTEAATALPYGVKSWKSLQSWQPLKSSTWSVSYKNGYGAEVVKFEYKVVYLAGGNLNGKGKYIGYAIVMPVKLNVAWGFTFNAMASVPVVYNIGTNEDPVAAMSLDIKWSVDTVLKHIEQTEVFNLTATGELKRM